MSISNQTARVARTSKVMSQAWKNDLRRWDGEIWVDGESLSPAEVLARLNDINTVHDRVRQCQLAFKAALRARNAALRKHQRFQAALTEVIRQKWTLDLKRMLAYGVRPVRRRGKLSSTKQAIAKAREAETRAVHGTKGKRQRAAITTQPKPTVEVQGLERKPTSPPAKER